MLERLNRALEEVEEDTCGPVDVAAMARIALTSEHHLRRLFSTLAGMPLSEYVRRRRLTLAGAEVLHGDDRLLDIAVRYGYGSAEAFARAFRAMHGVGPGQARRTGAVLCHQPRMVFRLVGPKARVPIAHQGRNSALEDFVRGVDGRVRARIQELSDQEPRGVLSVTVALSPDREEGSEVDYLHAAATSARGVEGMGVLEVPAGTWVVFPKVVPVRECPEGLQRMWADAFGRWFPSHPTYRAVQGPEMLRVVHSQDGARAKAEPWSPVERL